MRSIEELVKVDKKYYEKVYMPNGEPVRYHIAETMKVAQANGTVKIAYFYGEKTWSYNEKERDAYREKQNAIILEKRHKKNLLKQFEKMSIQELENILNERKCK